MSQRTGKNDETLRWNYLRFYSVSEIRIAERLDSLRIPFLPNCKGRFQAANGGVNFRPDFLIPVNGRWGVLEVDGPFHNPEDDRQRDTVLRSNGIDLIFRASAEACYNTPEVVVSRFMAAMTGPPQDEPDMDPVLPLGRGEWSADDDDDDDPLASLPWDMRSRIVALDCAIKSLPLQALREGSLRHGMDQVLSRAELFAGWLMEPAQEGLGS